MFLPRILTPLELLWGLKEGVVWNLYRSLPLDHDKLSVEGGRVEGILVEHVDPTYKIFQSV